MYSETLHLTSEEQWEEPWALIHIFISAFVRRALIDVMSLHMVLWWLLLTVVAVGPSRCGHKIARGITWAQCSQGYKFHSFVSADGSQTLESVCVCTSRSPLLAEFAHWFFSFSIADIILPNMHAPWHHQYTELHTSSFFSIWLSGFHWLTK